VKRSWWAVLCLLMTGALGAHGQECRPYWAGAGTAPPGESVDAISFDDGSGSAVFATWGIGTKRMWRWQDGQWTLAEGGLPSPWNYLGGLRVLDNGTGPQLCVFGGSASQTFWLATWDGSAWSTRWPGIITPNSWPLLSANLGGGTTIYGVMVQSESPAAARWNGTSWERLGPYFDGSSLVLTAFDDGGGAALYAAGSFRFLYGQPVGGFAKWSGSAWVAIGNSTAMDARQFITFDSGSGATLYLFGSVFVPGSQFTGVNRWDGQVWTSAGQMAGFTSIADMEVFDDGRGPALFVGGGFSSIGGVAARNIARFDGQNWEALGHGTVNGGVTVLAKLPTARGPSLMALGHFTQAGGGSSPTSALWVGCPNCYADCDLSGRLNVNDFICFMNKYAVRAPEANCTVDGVIDVADFVCFMSEFGRGCP